MRAIIMTDRQKKNKDFKQKLGLNETVDHLTVCVSVWIFFRVGDHLMRTALYFEVNSNKERQACEGFEKTGVVYKSWVKKKRLTLLNR